MVARPPSAEHWAQHELALRSSHATLGLQPPDEPVQSFRADTIDDHRVVGRPGDVQRQFDLVAAGINYGANLGDDITYSGTVAGALEAALLGVPAIAAISLCLILWRMTIRPDSVSRPRCSASSSNARATLALTVRKLAAAIALSASRRRDTRVETRSL